MKQVLNIAIKIEFLFDELESIHFNFQKLIDILNVKLIKDLSLLIPYGSHDIRVFRKGQKESDYSEIGNLFWKLTSGDFLMFRLSFVLEDEVKAASDEIRSKVEKAKDLLEAELERQLFVYKKKLAPIGNEIYF